VVTLSCSVGKFLVLALLHPAASRNKVLKVNSFTTTDHEILAEFEAQTGGTPWRTRYTSIDKLNDLEAAAWKASNPLATLFTLRRIWAEGGTLYRQRDNHNIDAEHVVDTLADAVAAAILVQAQGEKEVKRKLT
jgi:hypothetical protein